MKKTRLGAMPLMSVALTLRNESLPTLPNQMEIIISTFLDQSHKWTLESASKAGFALLIRRLAIAEWPGVGQVFRERRLKSAIRAATQAGNVLVLQSWLNSYRVPGLSIQSFVSSIFMNALRSGHLHVLQWLQQHELLPCEDLASVMTEDGQDSSHQGHGLLCKHAGVIMWLYDHDCSRYVDIGLEKAAEDCDFEFIQWIHQRHDQFRSIRHWDVAAYLAARSNRLDIVQWVYLNRPQDFTSDALKGAIEGAHGALAQWISAHSNFKIQDYSNLQAVNVTIVDFMLQEYQSIDSMDRRNYAAHALVRAAEFGRIDVMEFIHEHFMLEISGLSILPENGATEKSSILQWIGQDYASSHSHRYVEREQCAHKHWNFCALQRHYDYLAHRRIGKTAMEVATKAGHLQVVQWLLDHGVLGGSRILNSDQVWAISHCKTSL